MKTIILVWVCVLSAFAKASEKPFMTFQTSNSTFEFKLAMKNEGKISVDWGDGNLQEYEIGKSIKILEATTVKGNVKKNSEIKVFGKDIVFLYSREQGIKHLDLTNARDLRSIDCGMNSIQNIDVSNLPYLSYLNLYKNEIKFLDLSHNVNLRNINMSENNLSTLDFSFNPSVQHVSLIGNKLDKIVFNNPSKLTSLRVNNNLLKELHLTGAEALNFVDISANKIEDSCMLNKLYDALPSFSEPSQQYNLRIEGNAGVIGSNTNIAKNKNWKIDRLGKGNQKCD